ncbi:hypothetical protein [Pelomonas sp. Root1444]|uniref:hypothetical protein n=1 Tax=Pelomonas sp. Root1444 TaxID=1736464 RepID=UPI000703ACEB|nr:hypothetical protein [Pelomonas sp. Root1444]KQY83721.1 hypothetical protein ASD35_24170 [Pelomonas sp. Root1444]
MTALLHPREPALAAYSACRLCVHSAEAGLELACRHPDAAEPLAGPQPVAILRAPGGACGPNANRMEPRYLQPQARPL